MNVFDKLFTVTDMDAYLKENIHIINEQNNYEFRSVINTKDSIERFILLKSSMIEKLDYQKTYNKAFISILFDYCERFNFRAATQIVYFILESNEINIGHRLQAALLFLYNIDSIPTLVGRFDLICQKLQTSIEIEEDNDRKAVSTFLNYFSIVIRDTQPHVQYALEVKSKIEYSLSNKIFPFLKSEAIIKALKINLHNADIAFEQIQSIIDYLLDKTDFVEPVFEKGENVLLIEKDTEYSKTINEISLISFDTIKQISVTKCQNIPNEIPGRGVLPLEKENEMYVYMKRYGNMHKAKLISAFDLLPSSFCREMFDVFDWGCGQGIASMVLVEYLYMAYCAKVQCRLSQVTLIEPSLISLKRAAFHIKSLYSLAGIHSINKYFDTLDASDFDTNSCRIKVHLMSNVLDIDDFSMDKLFKLIENTQKGENYFVCVSPYITDAKADRVDSFCRYFSKYDSYELLGEETNGGKQNDEYWNCNNKYKSCMCSSHPHTCNGKNKWTRVIRVFKIEF